MVLSATNYHTLLFLQGNEDAEILESENFDKALTKSYIKEVNNMEHIKTTKWCIVLKGCKQGREYSFEKKNTCCVKERPKKKEIKQKIYITREVLPDLLPGNSGVLLKR